MGHLDLINLNNLYIKCFHHLLSKCNLYIYILFLDLLNMILDQVDINKFLLYF